MRPCTTPTPRAHREKLLNRHVRGDLVPLVPPLHSITPRANLRYLHPGVVPTTYVTRIATDRLLPQLALPLVEHGARVTDAAGRSKGR